MLYVHTIVNEQVTEFCSEDCISGDKQSINQSKGINLSKCRAFQRTILHWSTLYFKYLKLAFIGGQGVSVLWEWRWSAGILTV